MTALAAVRRLLLGSRQSCMTVMASGIPRGIVGTRRREADRTLRSIAVLEQALDRIEADPGLRDRVDEAALLSAAATLGGLSRHLAANAGAGPGDRRLPAVGPAQPGSDRPARAPGPFSSRPPRPPAIPRRSADKPSPFAAEPSESAASPLPPQRSRSPDLARIPLRPAADPPPRRPSQPPGPKIPLRRPPEPGAGPGRPTIYAQRNSALGRGAAPGDLAERLARSAVAFLASGGSQRWP